MKKYNFISIPKKKIMAETLICDSGTGYLKIGWSNEDFPTFTFPALVGRPLMRYEEKINDIEIKV